VENPINELSGFRSAAAGFGKPADDATPKKRSRRRRKEKWG
jgi:hypothetical protein